MTDRWRQVEKLCQSALELKESQRGAFLDQACAGDEELRREVESLLKFDKRGDRFIEEPALEVAAKMIAEKPESLIGQQLGSYQIVSLLGTGGMGVVYEARDIRLKRLVALKVLPREKMTDPERKKRFVQEARSASALNHPNIITIHDIGSENGIDFIVMEFVQGKTLDQRIPRKGMKLNEALKNAMQMAKALAKAHSAGIIHRDLKPTNVMVSDDGLVKVLDFGLAKLTEVGSGTGETLTRESLTEEGTIVGTVSYMSPEQAEGKKLDARSDIFSFGSVLYEMVSGQKAFEGHTKMSTLAAIVKEEPKPINQLVSDIPPELERIINRCLRKDPARRFQYIADVRIELDELKEESDSGRLPGASARDRTFKAGWDHQLAAQGRRRRAWTGAIALVFGIATVLWFFRRTGREPRVTPEVVPLTSYPGSEFSPSFSPDGNQVVFSWDGDKEHNRDIYLKLIGSPTSVRLTNDPADDWGPAFSPDGGSIGFIRVSKGRTVFMIIPSIGGPARIVAELTGLAYVWGRPFAWFPDGKWVVTDGLKLLSVETGETRVLTLPPNKFTTDSSPSVSPDGQTVAFSRSTGGGLVSDIYLLGLDSSLRPTGEPRRLTSLKGMIVGSTWTPNGREIVFSSGSAGGSDMKLWRVPTSGYPLVEPLPFGAGVSLPTVSGRGNRLAYMRWTEDTSIWRLPLSSPGVASNLPEKFISTTRNEQAAQYSPDGKQIAFESDRTGSTGIWVSDADGTNARELFSQAGATCGTPHWSPDGKRLAFDFSGRGSIDIYLIQSNGVKPVPLVTHSAYDAAPSWSRNGNWVYFTSDRTARPEVWKVPATGGEAVQVTHNGGGVAFESPDGQFLYYIKGGDWNGELWKMPVTGGEGSKVLASVVRRCYCLANEGVYFIPTPDPDLLVTNIGPSTTKKLSIQFLRFATGKVTRIAMMSGGPSEGLSLSPDGRFLLFSQFDHTDTDLVLVENFQ